MIDLGFSLDVSFMTNDRGRYVWLDELTQRPTYLTLLAGLPNDYLNVRIIERIRREAETRGDEKIPVFLIEPEPLEYGHRCPEEYRQEQTSRGLATERLPTVTCIAKLLSGSIIGDDGCCSSLTVVWFQDKLAMPIDPIVEAKLKAIDWDAHARGWDP